MPNGRNTDESTLLCSIGQRGLKSSVPDFSMKDDSLRILEIRSAQFGLPNTYMLVEIETSKTRRPVTTIQYYLWDELRIKLTSVRIEDSVLQTAKESLDRTGIYKIT